jgi:hypothetical protein
MRHELKVSEKRRRTDTVAKMKLGQRLKDNQEQKSWVLTCNEPAQVECESELDDAIGNSYTDD